MIAQVKTMILEDLDICHPGGTLAESQTQVNFALVREGDVTEDKSKSGALSAFWGVHLNEPGDSQGTGLACIGETATGSNDGEDDYDYPEVAAGENTSAIKSIAACARKSGAPRVCGCERNPQHTKAQPVGCRIRRLDAHRAGPRSARDAAHESQGRGMEDARAVHCERDVSDGVGFSV